MKPTISIIIPVYNIAPFLPRCLDSVLAQTYENLEIIPVDDGSTDGSGAILDSYAQKDRRIRVIHRQNSGVTAARLAGLETAAGQWVGFADGDDYLEPDMYRRLLDNALTYGADISHCGYRMVFPDGRTDFYHNTGKLLLRQGLQGCEDLLSGVLVEPGLWNKLYRRELFEGLPERMDIRIRQNEDLLMNFYLFQRSRSSVFEDFCPYHYILRKGSAATGAWNQHKLRDPLQVARIIYAEAPEVLKPPAFRRLVRLLIRDASLDPSSCPALVLPYRTQVRRELRKHLGQILRDTHCGPGLKAMALAAAFWPGGYGWVHRQYEKITGLDKKYHWD